MKLKIIVKIKNILLEPKILRLVLDFFLSCLIVNMCSFSSDDIPSWLITDDEIEPILPIFFIHLKNI